MRGMTRTTVGWWMVVIGFIAVVTVAAPASARAANNEMGDVLVDGFYGGLIGALVGGAVMVLTEHPGDHLHYMTTGAAIGVIGGTIYGLSKVAGYAMIDVDQGQVAWHVPAIEPGVAGAPGEVPEVSLSAALVRVRFR